MTRFMQVALVAAAISVTACGVVKQPEDFQAMADAAEVRFSPEPLPGEAVARSPMNVLRVHVATPEGSARIRVLVNDLMTLDRATGSALQQFPGTLSANGDVIRDDEAHVAATLRWATDRQAVVLAETERAPLFFRMQAQALVVDPVVGDREYAGPVHERSFCARD